MTTNDPPREQFGRVVTSTNKTTDLESRVKTTGTEIQSPASMSQHSHQYGSKATHNTIIPSVSTPSQDTLFVFLTLAFISITLYFSFFLWRKLRERPLATLYKLEEYRYSRLSQNELEVDSVVFYGDSLQPEISQNSDDDDECKPATLHLETDSLIAIRTCKPSVTTSPKNTGNNSGNGTQKTPVGPPTPTGTTTTATSARTPALVLQDSDEDLLQ